MGAGKTKAPYKNYEENNRKILSAYKALADAGNITPSFPEVVEMTKELDTAKGKGVSLATIRRHFSKLNFGFTCERERIYTQEVVEALRKSAIGKTGYDGKSRSLKLYFQIMENYIEKKEQKTDIVGELNVGAEITGELKVNIQRGIINSRADLEMLKETAAAIAKDHKDGEGKDDDKLQDAVSVSLGLLKEKAETTIQNVETMVFFK